MRTTVTKEMADEAAREVEQLGARPAMVKLSKVEPDLVEHVTDGMDRIWEKLRSYGIITDQGFNTIDENFYPTILGVIISSLEAQRKAMRATAAAHAVTDSGRLAPIAGVIHRDVSVVVDGRGTLGKQAVCSNCQGLVFRYYVVGEFPGDHQHVECATCGVVFCDGTCGARRATS